LEKDFFQLTRQQAGGRRGDGHEAKETTNTRQNPPNWEWTKLGGQIALKPEYGWWVAFLHTEF
jgi:hypothetical protein